MASGVSDQDAEYALSKLLQMARITEASFEDKNNQAVDDNVGDQEDPNVNNKQEVKKAIDQEIENVKDEEGKNIDDQQVSEGDGDTDNVDVGYMRQHIEDVSWFLAYEIDYLNDNEKKANHGNRVIRVVNGNNKGVDKEVQYFVYTLHVFIPFLKHLNDKHIKKKKMEATIQRRIWDPGIKSDFQDNNLRARWF
ncbi:hypothetical protein Tco_0693209 [Tanacetum coccineum]